MLLLGSMRKFASRMVRFLVLASFLSVSPLVFAQGRIDCSSFRSTVLHRGVRYCVMLPPGYEKETGKKYPELYFLHGLGENEQTLLRSGGWGLIEDLRQQHKIGDFLMVAPEGWDSFFINSADGRDRYSDFFLSEFLPYIETHYRTIRDRRARAVTGLSMGGYGALRFAFAHPELFGSVSERRRPDAQAIAGRWRQARVSSVPWRPQRGLLSFAYGRDHRVSLARFRAAWGSGKMMQISG